MTTEEKLIPIDLEESGVKPPEQQLTPFRVSCMSTQSYIMDKKEDTPYQNRTL